MGSNNRQKTKTGRTFVQCRTFSCRGHPLTRSAPKRAVLRQYPAVLNRRRHDLPWSCGPCGACAGYASGPGLVWCAVLYVGDRLSSVWAMRGVRSTGWRAAFSRARRSRVTRRCSRSSRVAHGGTRRARRERRWNSGCRYACLRTTTGSSCTPRSCGKTATWTLLSQ